MPKLGVNIDHVATVRQARRTDEPDPVWAAVQAQLGGADCITFHLRMELARVFSRSPDRFFVRQPGADYDVRSLVGG